MNTSSPSILYGKISPGSFLFKAGGLEYIIIPKEGCDGVFKCYDWPLDSHNFRFGGQEYCSDVVEEKLRTNECKKIFGLIASDRINRMASV